jgi:hypothetical protein
MSETPEQTAQNNKFGYKAPESVYQKHDPKGTLVGSGKYSGSLQNVSDDILQSSSWFVGKAFTGVSPMDFYLRQSAQKKAEKAKESETKVKLYQNNMYKGSL